MTKKQTLEHKIHLKEQYIGIIKSDIEIRQKLLVQTGKEIEALRDEQVEEEP